MQQQTNQKKMGEHVAETRLNIAPEIVHNSKLKFSIFLSASAYNWLNDNLVYVRLYIELETKQTSKLWYASSSIASY